VWQVGYAPHSSWHITNYDYTDLLTVFDIPQPITGSRPSVWNRSPSSAHLAHLHVSSARWHVPLKSLEESSEDRCTMAVVPSVDVYIEYRIRLRLRITTASLRHVKGSCIRHIGIWYRWVISFTDQGTGSRYGLDRVLREPHSSAGRGGEERK
jgi:hypothetical protein